MRTMASIIGKPDDPVVEAVARELSSQFARMEQMRQSRPRIIDYRRAEWKAAEAIIRTHKEAAAKELEEDC